MINVSTICFRPFPDNSTIVDDFSVPEAVNGWMDEWSEEVDGDIRRLVDEGGAINTHSSRRKLC